MPLPVAVADQLDRRRFALRREGRELVGQARPLGERLTLLERHIEQARWAHDRIYPRRRPS